MGRQSMTQECCAAAYELTAVDCMHRENDLHAMGGAQKGFLKRPEKIYKEGSGLKKLGAEYQKRRSSGMRNPEKTAFFKMVLT